MQTLNCDIVNWQGSIGLTGWKATEIQWANLINQNVTLTDFGGLKIDTTGNDSYNTAEKNPFNGTGKSRLTFCKDARSDYAWNNFTEVSEGAKLSVPVVAGDTVTVVCYGSSRNWGGFEKSALAAWLNGAFLTQLPIGLLNTIVPAYKKTAMGNRSYAVTGALYKVWLYSNTEVGGYTSNHPYMDEGSRYPIYTNDQSRIKKLADGTGAVCWLWERSPFIFHSSNYCSVITSGSPNSGGSASSSGGVSGGFSSGER